MFLNRFRMLLIIFALILFITVSFMNFLSKKTTHNTKYYLIEIFISNNTYKYIYVQGGDLTYINRCVIIKDDCYPFNDKIVISGDFIITLVKEEPCKK